jgi:putative peptidoglycan lipid II flippase
LSIKPQHSKEAASNMGAFWVQYFPFMIVAIFLGVTLPIDTLLATNLGEGAVSSFSLGNKVVLFILSLLSTVMTTVLLPYFSFIINSHGKAGLKRELSFFLFSGTLLSIPAAIAVYIYSDLITHIIFQSSLLNSKEATNISHVMQYGIIQLPFWVSNMILLKHANAIRHNKTIVFTSIIGLVLNILLSFILMPRMNISGISLAASIAVIVSSVILLIHAMCMKQVSVIDSIITFINWLLFTALVIAIHFASYSSVIMVVSTYILLGLVYIQRANNLSNWELHSAA